MLKTVLDQESNHLKDQESNHLKDCRVKYETKLITIHPYVSGYHDTAAYPVPSFYNPMPWQPIHIPRPASEKVKRRGKPKTKHAWNPEKYR